MSCQSTTENARIDFKKGLQQKSLHNSAHLKYAQRTQGPGRTRNIARSDGDFWQKTPFSGLCEREGKWGSFGPQNHLFQEMGIRAPEIKSKNLYLQLEISNSVRTRGIAMQVDLQGRLQKSVILLNFKIF